VELGEKYGFNLKILEKIKNNGLVEKIYKIST